MARSLELLQAGHSIQRFLFLQLGLPRTNRCQTGGHTAGTSSRIVLCIPPASKWRLSHASQLFQVPESQPGALFTLLPTPSQGQTGTQSLLQSGATAWSSGMSMGHLGCSAAGEANLAPSVTGRDQKGTGLLPKLLEGQTGEWPPQPAS